MSATFTIEEDAIAVHDTADVTKLGTKTGTPCLTRGCVSDTRLCVLSHTKLGQWSPTWPCYHCSSPELHTPSPAGR